MPEIPQPMPPNDPLDSGTLEATTSPIDERITLREVLHETISFKNLLTGLAGFAVGIGISYLCQKMNFHRISPKLITAIPLGIFTYLHFRQFLPIFVDDPGGKPTTINFPDHIKPWTRTTFDSSLGMFCGTLLYSISTRLFY